MLIELVCDIMQEWLLKNVICNVHSLPRCRVSSDCFWNLSFNDLPWFLRKKTKAIDKCLREKNKTFKKRNWNLNAFTFLSCMRIAHIEIEEEILTFRVLRRAVNLLIRKMILAYLKDCSNCPKIKNIIIMILVVVVAIVVLAMVIVVIIHNKYTNHTHGHIIKVEYWWYC